MRYDDTDFWARIYALKYIGLGISAFVLPSHAWYEVAIRIFIIIIGIHLYLTTNKKRILQLATVVLSGWVVFAFFLILGMWPSDYSRLLLFTMPFWAGWIAGHFYVLKKLDDSRA